ncbi:MAG TPA: type II toxin-antitoxin system prevent-host-death family antitoxin [Hyphomicrobiales bacterium]|nr:type II toxin-antitoxin system prevent-host-death family antitoxin [Hyphomicrobiales bacterium]
MKFESAPGPLKKGSNREKLLDLFIANRGKPVTRAAMLKAVYGTADTPAPRVMMVLKGLKTLITDRKLPYEIKKEGEDFVLYQVSSNWTIADAKARFSELVTDAQSKGPQTITKHGHPAAIVVAPDEWERKTKRSGSLADFFAASPLRNSGLEIMRRKDRAQNIEL